MDAESKATEIKTAVMDANGDVSSKRVWGFRFGWATLVQIAVVITSAVILSAFGIAIPLLVFDFAKYTVATTAIVCGWLFGLTVPEWFGNRK